MIVDSGMQTVEWMGESERGESGKEGEVKGEGREEGERGREREREREKGNREV